MDKYRFFGKNNIQLNNLGFVLRLSVIGSSYVQLNILPIECRQSSKFVSFYLFVKIIIPLFISIISVNCKKNVVF